MIAMKTCVLDTLAFFLALGTFEAVLAAFATAGSARGAMTFRSEGNKRISRARKITIK